MEQCRKHVHYKIIPDFASSKQVALILLHLLQEFCIVHAFSLNALLKLEEHLRGNGIWCSNGLL